MKIKNQLVASRARTSGEGNPCTSITVHETGNTDPGADAQAHANLQSNGNVRQASWHITVDDKQAIRSFPDTVKCWHAGDATGNGTSIAVEICVNSDGNYQKALANAAEAVKQLRERHGLPRSAVKQHKDWSGKNCPTKLRASGKWAEFVASTDPTNSNNRKEAPVSKMVSPMKGRYTSAWNPSRYISGLGRAPHNGCDIAPTIPGTVGTPVYAAFGGQVRKVVKWAKRGNKASTWAPGRTGNGILISNPDGEGQGYNHVRAVVKVGQKVKAGQLIGYTDTSGTQTGPHLHFETWRNWRDPSSHFNPAILFTKYGVKIGSKPKGVSGGKKKAAKWSQGTKTVQRNLNTLGYDAGPVDGKRGPRTKAAVKAFKTDWGLPKDTIWGKNAKKKANQILGLRKKPGLLVDGDFGPLTIATLQWVLKAAGNYAGRIDGKFGPNSKKAYKRFLKAKGFDRKGLKVGTKKFGKPARLAEQTLLLKRGFLPSQAWVDGLRGKATVQALQRALNRGKLA